MTFKDILRKRAKKEQSIKALKKLNVYDIIIRPITPQHTEKAYKLSEIGKYMFVVHKDSNKNDVKNAVKYIYNVDVEGVNIINVPSTRNMSRLTRKSYKKAIVTLKKGQKIEFVS